MRSTVRFVYTLVVVTGLGACAPRGPREVARPDLALPPSNAYDATAHAMGAAAADQRVSLELSRRRASLLEMAHFDFFWPIDQLVYPIVRAGLWTAPDRALIRGELARIKSLIERRRAFHDDDQLIWNYAQARMALAIFDQHQAQIEALHNAEVNHDAR